MLLQLPFSLVTIRARAICPRLFAPRDVYDVQNQTPFIVKLGFIENATTVEGKKLYARQREGEMCVYFISHYNSMNLSSSDERYNRRCPRLR